MRKPLCKSSLEMSYAQTAPARSHYIESYTQNHNFLQMRGRSQINNIPLAKTWQQGFSSRIATDGPVIEKVFDSENANFRCHVSAKSII